jgi:hypothetical protein
MAGLRWSDPGTLGNIRTASGILTILALVVAFVGLKTHHEARDELVTMDSIKKATSSLTEAADR